MNSLNQLLFLLILSGTLAGSAPLPAGSVIAGQQAVIPNAPSLPVPVQEQPKPAVAKPIKARDIKESKDKKEIEFKPLLHDVAIFFDVREKNPGAIMRGFALAVCQNGWSAIGYPIVVTSHTLHAFLNYKDEYLQKIIPSIPERFDIYKTMEEDFYLLIPKSYMKKLTQTYSNEVQERIRKIAAIKKLTLEDFLSGFALSKLTKLKDPLKKDINVINFINVESVKSIFLTKKDLAPGFLGMWNIVLDGHGRYSNELANQIAQGLLPDQLKILSEKQFVDAFIVGLTLTQYRNLLQFFILNIHTHFLYYGSCYAGGYNTLLGYIDAIINQEGILKSQIKPNFIIAVGALTDIDVFETSHTDSVANCFACISKQEKEHYECIDKASKNRGINFVRFFDALRAYARKDQLVGTLFNDQQLHDILNHITPKIPGSYRNNPQIMFPGTDMFRAIALDKDMEVITETRVKVHALEKKPIIIENKRIILVYPLDIPVELIFKTKTFPFIVSGLPSVNVHILSKITAPSLTLRSFLSSISETEQRNEILGLAFDRYFYVKSLMLKDNIILKNVFVHIREKQLHVIYSDVHHHIYQDTLVVPLLPLTQEQYYNYSAKKLNNTFYDGIIPDNQFLNTLANYLSIPEVSAQFNAHLLFNLLSAEDLIQLKKSMALMRDRLKLAYDFIEQVKLAYDFIEQAGNIPAGDQNKIKQLLNQAESIYRALIFRVNSPQEFLTKENSPITDKKMIDNIHALKLEIEAARKTLIQ